MKIIIWVLIIVAVIAVCVKKVKDFKAGRYCGCNCSDCLKKCKKVENTEDNKDGEK